MTDVQLERTPVYDTFRAPLGRGVCRLNLIITTLLKNHAVVRSEEEAAALQYCVGLHKFPPEMKAL